jgi:hypothetical protein
VDLTTVLRDAAGPYGALFLALVGIVFLWRKLEQSQQMLVASQALTARSQDLFEEALKVIKDDLVPLLREMPSRHR